MRLYLEFISIEIRHQALKVILFISALVKVQFMISWRMEALALSYFYLYLSL